MEAFRANSEQKKKKDVLLYCIVEDNINVFEIKVIDMMQRQFDHASLKTNMMFGHDFKQDLELRLHFIEIHFGSIVFQSDQESVFNIYSI